MSDQRRKRRRREGLKADYGDATPEQVAEAVLRWNPDGPNRPQPSTRLSADAGIYRDETSRADRTPR